MKQIPFNHELLNTPGIIVKYRDGSEPLFKKVFGDRIVSIDSAGTYHRHKLDGYYIYLNPEHDLLMYRQARTAEEVARDVWREIQIKSGHNANWNYLPIEQMDHYVKLVQAGMDEMKNDNP